MTMRKRLWAVLVCVMLLVSLLPATAFAAPTVTLEFQSGRLVSGSDAEDDTATFHVEPAGFSQTPTSTNTNLVFYMYTDEACTNLAYSSGLFREYDHDTYTLTLRAKNGSASTSAGTYYIKISLTNAGAVQMATSNAVRIVVYENLGSVDYDVDNKTLKRTTANMEYSLDNTNWTVGGASTINDVDVVAGGGTLYLRYIPDRTYTHTINIVAPPSAPTLESRGFDYEGDPTITLFPIDGHEYSTYTYAWTADNVFSFGKTIDYSVTFFQRIRTADTVSAKSAGTVIYTLPLTPPAVPIGDMTVSDDEILINATKSNDKHEYAVTLGTASEAPESGWVTGTGSSGEAITLSSSLTPGTNYKVWVRVKSFIGDGNAVSPASYAASTSVTTTGSYDTGDFTVSGGAPGTDYTYESHVLHITGEKTYTIGMKQGVTTTTDRINVDVSGGAATLNLDGVYIDAENDLAALTINNGNVTLNATASSTIAGNSTVIEGGFATITFSGGTLTVTGGGNEAGRCGIRGNVTVTGGSLTATGSSNNDCDGIRGNVTVSGGSLSATGGSGSACEGIEGSVTVTGGSLSATGGSGNSADCDGIRGDVTVTGGSLSATGGAYSFGINGTVTADPADFVIKAGDAASALSIITSPATTDKRYVTVTSNTEVELVNLEYITEFTSVTTALRLEFDADVEGLSADDITLTYATKGTLTKQAGTGVYELAISNLIGDEVYVHLAFAKAGFTFIPADTSIPVPNITVASIGNVTVSGVKGKAITPADAIITLADRLVAFDTLEAGDDVSDWFTNLPAGLTAKIKTRVEEYGTSVTVTFSGTPTAVSTAAMTVTIPANCFTARLEDDIIVAPNASAKWSISEPPTPPDPPTPTSVAVNPASVSVQKGGTQTFNATVFGANNPAQTVTWSVTGGTAGTSIDEDGVLTVAADETAAMLTVKATSTVDTEKFGVANVTVTTSAPVEYQITRGANSEWTKGGTAGLSFTADGDYADFTGVSVDGTAISSDKYTSASGSTVVTLKASYLETLSAGRHTLKVSFTDGYTETRFTIVAAAIPATGDDSHTLLWLGIALLAGAGLTVSLVLGRRERKNG